MSEFKQFSKIKRLGDLDNKGILDNPNDKITVQEKLDGGNFRFYFSEDGAIIFGSRTQQLTDSDGLYVDNVDKSFKACADYVTDKILSNTTVETRICLSGLIFYGEAMHKHTIVYDWENTPRFIGFDVLEEDTFWSQEGMMKIFTTFGLETAPVVYHGTRDNYIKEVNDDAVPMSKYGNFKAEGIVIKNETNGLRAKYVRDEFKERNAEAFGGSPKYNKVDDTNNADFVFKYCTNARISKVIFKLVDEGKRLHMSLMPDVIRSTYNDIVEEEWKEILHSNWKLDFKDIRKLIAKRCIHVLEAEVTESVRD
jgi:ATP-dependent RNA circularization protein (DNA/RNA ligase family)